MQPDPLAEALHSLASEIESTREGVIDLVGDFLLYVEEKLGHTPGGNFRVNLPISEIAILVERYADSVMEALGEVEDNG